MATEFTERLKAAFDNATMAEIARRLNVPHATIRNYFQGRMPAPEVLIKIANETNVSLNWLLAGTGEMYLRGREPLDLGDLIDRRIEELIDRRMGVTLPPEVQNLGAIDDPPPFDVAEAVIRLNDPEAVMSAWFQHEGREYPADYGVIFFQGWESFSPAERVDAIRDAKKVLDRSLKRAKNEG
jgi:AcrR family transcriptional regulator